MEWRIVRKYIASEGLGGPMRSRGIEVGHLRRGCTCPDVCEQGWLSRSRGISGDSEQSGLQAVQHTEYCSGQDQASEETTEEIQCRDKSDRLEHWSLALPSSCKSPNHLQLLQLLLYYCSGWGLRLLACICASLCYVYLVPRLDSVKMSFSYFSLPFYFALNAGCDGDLACF